MPKNLRARDCAAVFGPGREDRIPRRPFSDPKTFKRRIPSKDFGLQAAEPLAFPAVRPNGFTLASYVVSRHFNYSNGDRCRLTLVFCSSLFARQMTETPFAGGQTLERQDDGTWRLTAVTDDSVQLDGWLPGRTALTLWPSRVNRSVLRSADCLFAPAALSGAGIEFDIVSLLGKESVKQKASICQSVKRGFAD